MDNYTAHDHTASILISILIGLACAPISGAIRIISRTRKKSNFGKDDYWIGAATVSAVIQYSFILVALLNGLGKNVDNVAAATMIIAQQFYYAGTLLFVITLSLSKLSTIALLLRVTSGTGVLKQVCNALAGFVGLWTLGSFLAMALQCNLSQPWAVAGESCSRILLRWQLICAFDIITEVATVICCVGLVWGLQASLSKKVFVVVSYVLRLPLILPIIFRLITFRETKRDTDFFLYEGRFVVCTETQLNYALISATIPCLRPFFRVLKTWYRGPAKSESAMDLKSCSLSRLEQGQKRVGNSTQDASSIASNNSQSCLFYKSEVVKPYR